MLSLMTILKHIQYTWFLPTCQNQIQVLFKYFQEPYEGYIRRTELNQTGTFISIYKQVKLTFDNLASSGINQKLQLSEKLTKCKCIFLSAVSVTTNFTSEVFYTILENQIQALSRNLRHRFKDSEEPCLFSRTFHTLKIWQKNLRIFKDSQEP